MIQTARTLAGSVTQEGPSPKMTYDEFLAWCDEDTWAEWVDGEVYMVSPASTRHQLVKKFLVGILDGWVQHHALGVVLDAPFQMRLPTRPSGREPDLIFVASAHRARLKQTFLDGAADLAVEIISPESIGRDRGEKFVEYEAAGVREYWLIDPDREQAEFYALGSNKRYHLINADADGIFRSQVVKGFFLRVAWLWQEPLPKVVEVLKELKVV